MKHPFKQKLIRLIVIAVLFLLALPVLAQDSTTEPAPAATVDAPVIINAGEGGNVIVEAPAPDVPAEPPTDPEPWYAKYAANLLGLAGVITAGIVALNKWLEARKKDAGSMTLLEQAYAWSPAFLKKMVVALIKQLIRLGDNLQEVLDEATDDTPYVVKVTKVPTSPDLPSSDAATTWASRGGK